MLKVSMLRVIILIVLMFEYCKLPFWELKTRSSNVGCSNAGSSNAEIPIAEISIAGSYNWKFTTLIDAGSSNPQMQEITILVIQFQYSVKTGNSKARSTNGQHFIAVKLGFDLWLFQWVSS